MKTILIICLILMLIYTFIRNTILSERFILRTINAELKFPEPDYEALEDLLFKISNAPSVINYNVTGSFAFMEELYITIKNRDSNIKESIAELIKKYS